jgi:hypothetical protein
MVGGGGGVVPKLGPDGRQLRACGAIRVSEGKQAEGYSPSTQRQAILQGAHADGYAMDEEDIYEDHARGHVLTRKGYVAILQGARRALCGGLRVHARPLGERQPRAAGAGQRVR